MKVAIFLGFCLILVSCRKSRPGPSSETTTQAAEETTTEAVTNDAGEADDDDVVSLVKSYIDSGTCNTVTFSETDCGDTASSYYKEVIYNNKRVIISNNVR